MKQFLALSLFIIFLKSLSIFNSLSYTVVNLPYEFTQDSLQIALIKDKIKLLARQKNYDSAINYSKTLLSFSKKIPDSSLLAESHFRLGFYQKKLDQYSTSFLNYNHSYRIHLALGDSLNASNRLISMANIQKGIGDFTASQETAIEALKYLIKTDHYRNVSGLYHIISVSLKEQKNYSESLKWNEKAISLLISVKKKSNLETANMLLYKNTKANILAEEQHYDESISIFKSLLEEKIVKANKIEYARLLTNLGRVKWLENPTNNESEKLLLQSLQIRKERNSISGLISSNIHLSKYYKNVDLNKSLQHATAALKNAQTLKNPISILEALDLVIPIKTELGLELHQEAVLYSKTRNELTEIQQKVRSIYATTKYDNNKLTNDNLVLKAEKAQKEKQNLLYLSAFLASLLAIGFIVYFKNQQRKRAKIEAAYRTEIRFAKKIHDEVGNDIFYLMTQIKKNPQLTENREALMILEGLDTVYQKARDITREYTPIKTDETYGDELMALMNSYSSDSIKIATTKLDSSFWDVLSHDKKIQFFWIVRELFTNMRKHSMATFIGITFTKTDGSLEINYTDNGIGFEKSNSDFGNGLKNVENRMHDLKGSINFDSKPNEGLTIKMKFPI